LDEHSSHGVGGVHLEGARIEGDAKVAGVLINLNNSLAIATEEKKTYTEKLEMARGDDIFKYLLLINTSALDAYVAQARLQAEQSFALSRRLALAGFVLLAVGIALGVAFNVTGRSSLDAAYLAAIAGGLTQFISGVMFYMYNRTLQQINRFHDKMISSQHVSMAFLAGSQVTNLQSRDDHRAELAKTLMTSLAEQKPQTDA
jgi:hypothetical protein